MKIGKQVGQIARAFTSSAPDTEWYKERNEICDSCEYSSLNIEKEKLSTANKLVLNTVCDRVCTACGCCTQEKTKLADSVCGLIEIGQKPKWGAVEVYSKTKGVSVELLNKDLALSGDKSEFFITFETEKDLEKIELIFKGKELVSAIGSCSCMSTFIEELGNNEYKVMVDISTIAFSKIAETTRRLTLNFMKQNGRNTDVLTITFKITKI